MITQTVRTGLASPPPGLLGLGWGQASGSPPIRPPGSEEPWRGKAVFGATPVNGSTNEYRGLKQSSARVSTFQVDVLPSRVVEISVRTGEQIITALTAQPTAFRKIAEAPADPGGPTLWALLDDLQGAIEGEEDWSENVDQYLYGDEALG